MMCTIVFKFFREFKQREKKITSRSLFFSKYMNDPAHVPPFRQIKRSSIFPRIKKDEVE